MSYNPAISDTYVNLYTDFGFKRIFGTESNKELLRSFLNALLEKEEHIESLEFMNPEHLGAQPYERKAVYDVYCRSSSGDSFIVEMQCARQEYFKDRALFYATFPIREQAVRGPKWNFRLDRIYAIGILDFAFDSTPEYLHTVMLSDIMTGKVFYDKLKFIFIEMPKFQKGEEGLETEVDKWLYALKHMSDFSAQPKALSGDVFGKLFQEAALAGLTRSELATYEENLKIARDNFNVLNTAHKVGYEKGKKNGLAEGKEIGLAEGKEIGLAEGKEIGLAAGKEIGLAEGKEIGLAEGKEIGFAEGEENCLEKIRVQLRALGIAQETIEKATRWERH